MRNNQVTILLHRLGGAIPANYPTGKDQIIKVYSDHHTSLHVALLQAVAAATEELCEWDRSINRTNIITNADETISAKILSTKAHRRVKNEDLKSKLKFLKNKYFYIYNFEKVVIALGCSKDLWEAEERLTKVGFSAEQAHDVLHNFCHKELLWSNLEEITREIKNIEEQLNII